MYCPICKQNFKDIGFCPCCVDDNGNSIKLIPTPKEDPEPSNGEIKIDNHIDDVNIPDADANNISVSVSQDIDQQLLTEVQQQLHQEMGLEPSWMCDVKYFCVYKADGSCEEGYRLAYEDMRKNFGRKLWIEVDKLGKLTRVITTK